MTSLIKIFGLLFLSSCSSLSLLDSSLNDFSIISNKLKKQKNTHDILVSSGFFNSRIFSPSSVDDSLWIDSSSNSIIKICGIKICFYKFHDFEFRININENISLTGVLNGNYNNIKSYLEFKNPDSGFLIYSSTYSINKKLTNPIFINGKDIQYFVIEEKFNVPKIKWSGKNYYYFNSQTNELIKAQYAVSPNLKALKVYFNKS
jgi:hypothetical protein